MTIPLRLSQFLEKKLRFERIFWPLVFAIVVGLAGGAVITTLLVRADLSVAQAVAPHVATLIETNDRVELQRFVSVLSQNRATRIDVIQKNYVLASTDVSAVGHPPGIDKVQTFFGFIRWSGDNLVTITRIQRRNGPELHADFISFFPMMPMVATSLTTMAVIALLSLALSRLLVKRMSRAAHEALRPVHDLQSAIKSIAQDLENGPGEILPIRELESVRLTIENTRRELKIANEALISSRASELAARMSETAYQALIHDLHTPVAALQQWIKIANAPGQSEAVITESHDRVGQLASQILNQIKSYKSHLTLRMTNNETSDLRPAVELAIENSLLASQDRSIRVKKILPSEKIQFAHDPDLLTRAVSNLITNALEACRENIQVKLTVSDGQPRIVVADDGPGMRDEQVSLHLQGKGQSSKANRMGLGLSSVNHIARLHGGHVVYTKSPLGGAQFEILLNADLGANA